MKLFKRKSICSMLLVVALVLTMLPTAAFAAELDVPEEHIHTEACSHETALDSGSVEIGTHLLEASPDEISANEQPDAPVEVAEEEVNPDASELIPEDIIEAVSETPKPEAADETSGTVGNSLVRWVLMDGRLFITGEGDCETFSSPADQPWAAHRAEIREVWFDGAETLEISNLAYWFAGCTALETAEIPYTTYIIGTDAFANCPSLSRVMLYHSGVSFEIADGAFRTDSLSVLEVACIVEDANAVDTLFNHNWSASNRAAFFVDIYGTTYMATGYCSYCGKTCSYSLDYEQWTSSVHCIRHWCSNCGSDQCGGVNAGNHSYNSSGYCTYCGYYNSAYDNSSVCYHTSTRTTWSGCDWYEYCRNCGELVDYGTSHGNYSYGAWEYYNSSRHRRYYSCDDCGEGSYTYGYHATTTQYSQYSSTQHQISSYCATCSSYVGASSYENHSFTYGSWQNYSGTQHRRLKTCSVCGYSTYEYASHSLSYGTWTSYNSSQHRRTASCSCGFSTYEYASHAFTYGSWTSISDSQHSRSKTCGCGYSETETASHADNDENGYCDSCNYLMSRFSVTVPASLSLTVAKNGTVHSATAAQIVNNSTGSVCVSSVKLTAENGWSIVPYSTNMANAKVDAKRIGFRLNDAESLTSGTGEALSLGSTWAIAKGGSLNLDYDAVVSATSDPISEQVITIVFVLGWKV